MALSADGADFKFLLTAPERKTSIGIGQGQSFFDHKFDFTARYENGTGSSKVDAVYSAETVRTNVIGLPRFASAVPAHMARATSLLEDHSTLRLGQRAPRYGRTRPLRRAKLSDLVVIHRPPFCSSVRLTTC